MFQRQWHCVRNTRAYRGYLYSSRESYSRGPHQVELPSSQEGEPEELRAATMSTTVSRHYTRLLYPHNARVVTLPSRDTRACPTSRLVSIAARCKHLSSAPLALHSARTAISLRFIIVAHTRSLCLETAALRQSNGLSVTRSRCAASSQHACRGCPHSVLGSSTKLAK